MCNYRCILAAMLCVFAFSTVAADIEAEATKINKRLALQKNIVRCHEQIQNQRKSIERERKIAKVSGYENAAALHAAGASIIDCEERQQKDISEYRRLGGERTIDSVIGNEGAATSAERATLDLHMINQEQEALAQQRATLKENLRQEAERQAQLDAARGADQLDAARGAMIADWAAVIAARIRKFVQLPMGSPPMFGCQVAIEQLPGGDIVSAKVIRSCGSAAVDRAVESAVVKASPLPPPPDPSVFARSLLMNYCYPDSSGCR